MSEQGFHEIQLNGKQLVFLFMAATVVSVVIFLCGVMVGRGVGPAVAAGADPKVTAAVAAGHDGESDGARSLGAAPAGGDAVSPQVPPDQAPVPVQDGDDYDFDDRLTGQRPVDRLEGQPPEPPASKASAPSASRTAAKPGPAEKAPQVQPGAAQPGAYAVQLVALRERSDADAIARRLVGKGYSAYVVMPAPGGTPVYKVQVGRFRTRGDAEKAAAKLRAEEQFKPWVTR